MEESVTVRLSKRHSPILGNTTWYSVPHCGQLTAPPLFPFCFSSSQRCRHAWWIHLVQPLHRQGLTHSALWSSRSVAKHTQQCLDHTQMFQMLENSSHKCRRSRYRLFNSTHSFWSTANAYITHDSIGSAAVRFSVRSYFSGCSSTTAMTLRELTLLSPMFS